MVTFVVVAVMVDSLVVVVFDTEVIATAEVAEVMKLTSEIICLMYLMYLSL